jgi:cytochrome c5
MRFRSAMLIFVSVMLLVFAIGCAKQEPPKTEAPAAPAAAAPAAPAATAPAAPAADGKTLFEAKCSVCHGLDRATVRHETKEKWASILKEMQGRKADWISDAEASQIVDYLAAEHGKK